jgi:flagella basal body P-ring formation protein FlgA
MIDMKTIQIIKVLGFFLILSPLAVSNAEPTLRIYLPREVRVESRAVTLGDIAVVRGETGAVEKAGEIGLGRFSMPRQELVISRAMILGRLTASGFVVGDIEITGAEKVVVSQRRQIIRADRITEEAESFLKKNCPDNSVCRYEAIGRVDDFVLPDDAKKVELQASLAGGGRKDRMKVNVAVITEDRIEGICEVEFRPSYYCRKAVALRDIRQGEIISKDNVKITQDVSREAESSDWQVPYGLAAKRPIAANSLVTPGMVGPVQREVLVKRNSHVMVIYDRPGLSVTAVGKAMEDGREGDYIKVRMQIKDTPRLIYAKVKENGTLEPLM